ncbi:tetratricopeptide repeat protein 28 [Nematostella vectensis]|uniref:tetratricopeptide repeat protein 28 n=1 Tax=Nematostella vectensis TaxID=45351 RepID=UPI002077991E|nr:tetratricopeptide repeat protein 28 [Nematostella vectensis]
MSKLASLSSKGNKAFSRDELIQAIAYYSEALEIEPDDEDVLGCRSAVYTKLGMFNEARKDADRLIANVPDKPKGYFLQAAALQNLGNHSSALLAYLKTYELDTNHPLEIVLNIVQAAGCLCQMTEDDEINLSETEQEESKKFQILVQIGKRLFTSNSYDMCISVLGTALKAHHNITNQTDLFGQNTPSSDATSTEHRNTTGAISKDTTPNYPSNQFPAMYLTTGFHGDDHGSNWGTNDQLPFDESLVLMSALLTIAQAHVSMRQYPQAMVFTKKCMEHAIICDIKEYELKSYVKLANISQRLGDYLEAISYNAKFLAIGRDISMLTEFPQELAHVWNHDEERKALWNLSLAYKCLGDYEKALGYANEYIEVVKCVDEENLIEAYANLGMLQIALGGHDKALDSHSMELRIAKKFANKTAMAYAYGNIANVHAESGNFAQAEVNHEQHLKLAKNLNDRVCELVSIKQFGDMHRLKCDYSKALDYYETHLSLAKVNGLEDTQCTAYRLIGQCYWCLNQLNHSQHYYERCLELSCQLGNKEDGLEARHSLARIMKSLRQYEKSRQYFNDVIPVLEHRLHLKQGKDLVLHDALAIKLQQCYNELQEVLAEIEQFDQALELSEHCKARLLVNILRHKSIITGRQRVPELSPHTAEEIIRIVNSQQAHVIVYSVVDSGFMGWLLSPGKGMTKFHRYKNCEHKDLDERIKGCIEEIHGDHTTTYKCDHRALPNAARLEGKRDSKVYKTQLGVTTDFKGTEEENKSESTVFQHQHENTTAPMKEEAEHATQSSCFMCTFTRDNFSPLQKLYQILILPFEEFLTEGDKLVVVPDGVLSMVPFPSLQSTQGRHLYETLHVSILPCIRVISLATRKHQPDSSGDILVAGNATIPNVTLDQETWCSSRKSELAEEELNSVSTLLGTTPITGVHATKECVLEALGPSSVVHLTAFGSWQRGCLAFAPNPFSMGEVAQEDAYLLTLADLAAIDMQAKVVVLSSCCSCSHKFCYLKQASFTLATALLAAGAVSVVMPLWSLPQPVLLKLYYYFYTALEMGKTVVEALRDSLQRVKAKNSDPASWASHIVLGNDTTVNLQQLRHKLYDKTLDTHVHRVATERFGLSNDLSNQETNTVLSGPDKIRRFRSLLTSLMLQHVTLPRVLPALRDLIKLANSMLSAYEEGQRLDKLTMCAQLSSEVLDAPYSRDFLLVIGFNFQKDGAHDRDPFVVFPHWDYDSTMDVTAHILDAVCLMYDVSGLCGHSLARILGSLTAADMDRLKEIVSITTRYPARIVKTNDYAVRPLWYNSETQRFMTSLGFYDVGQSLLFNKNAANQSLLKAALQIISGLIAYPDMGQARVRSSSRELCSEDSRRVKLTSLSPLITASKQVVMGTPWMSKRAPPDEAQLKLKLARELEAIKKDFRRVVTSSNYWHAQLLRTQSSIDRSLPVIGREPKTLQPRDNTSPQRKVKVVSGLTPSCNRRLAEEEPSLSIAESRDRRNAVYKVYAQRYDEITLRKRTEIRDLFMSHAQGPT